MEMTDNLSFEYLKYLAATDESLQIQVYPDKDASFITD